ncbi:hypothetical protein PMIN01_05212 [Paraphaeosphaeria minitans]|uniref:Secreted protein n=1 Tax=Paraphaeosphaeria minitans TaxID=565426 RepID=A0A9P6GL99_9PLEO|nr:hypothetical protein PMIN01_05212 [Paraphaeosphaeria minitans]
MRAGALLSFSPCLHLTASCRGTPVACADLQRVPLVAVTTATCCSLTPRADMRNVRHGRNPRPPSFVGA